ncbi:MAG TPA: ADOP family duplicated permease [Vicinamibacterales bacterium]|jgi:putative ABC transport system permease protein
MRWWGRLLRRGRIERELDAELRYDFDRRVDDFVAGGMTAGEARRAARLEFGGLEQVKEMCRDARGTRWASDAAADARYAVRVLRKDRGYAIVAVAALGLAIAVNNTQFAIVDGYCIRGLPIAAADRVAFVASLDRVRGPGGMSYADYLDLRLRATAFAQTGAFAIAPSALADAGGAADGVTAAYISVEGLSTLGREPALGRAFTHRDGQSGAPLAVLLSQRVWRSRYDADPAVLGRVVRVDGMAGEVVGVMPDGFSFPGHADIWVPLSRMPGVETARRDGPSLGVFGRLRDGTTMAAARSELAAIAGRLETEHPASNAGVGLSVEPINAHFNGRLTDPAWLAFTIVGLLVVVIGCANVASLLLMRSAVRSRELAMRTALGATRWRIVRILLVETATLAVLGSLLGLALSAIALRLFELAVPAAAIPYGGLSVNGHVLGVLAIVTCATVLLCGVAPALSAVRTDVAGALKSGGLGATHGAKLRRWTTGLLTVEFAMSVILVSAVGLSLDMFRRAQDSVARIDSDHLLTLRFAAPSRYATPALRSDLCDRLGDRLAAIPGVASVSFTNALALAGPPVAIVAERAVAEPKAVPSLSIDHAYFQAVGLAVTSGRPPATHARDEVVVNARLARLLFPDGSALGRTIRLAPAVKGTSASMTIVGIAPDLRRVPGAEPDPIVYLPFAASQPSRAAILIRTAGAPAALAPLVREAVRAVDADLPIVALQTAEQAERDASWNRRMSATIITTIACIALLLAAVGLFAVTGYGVAQRTREIGIRMALGAGAGALSWLVLRGVLVQVLLGLGAGLVLNVLWERRFGGPGHGGVDPLNVAAILAVFAVVALLASAAPIARAMRVDPLLALRGD